MTNTPHLHTAEAPTPGRGRWRGLRFLKNPKVAVGVVLLVGFVLLAVAHPVLEATAWSHKPQVYDPVTGYDTAVTHPSGPGAGHLLGTDPLGRDVLSMLTYASGPTVLAALIAALVIVTTSGLLGVSAAWFRGVTDGVVTHVSDALALMPPPLMIFVLGAGKTSWTSVKTGIAYGILFGLGPATAAARAAGLTVIAKPFIDAARTGGGGSVWILRRHVLPHLVPTVAVQTMIGVTGALITDAFLQFTTGVGGDLGFGTMVYYGIAFDNLFATAPPWAVLVAGTAAISLLAAAFYVLGVGLREYFDPAMGHKGSRSLRAGRVSGRRTRRTPTVAPAAPAAVTPSRWWENP